MNNKVFFLFFLTMFLFASSIKSYGQRSNYNEQDIIMMRNQQSVCTNIIKLLEDKNIDSAMHFFKDKSAATKKKLSAIATEIQKFKGKHEFSASADAPDNEVNHVICKYTSEEGEKTHYKVLFVFDRFDESYKSTAILFK